MKEGDVIFCIKTRKSSIGTYNKKGKRYEILGFDDDIIVSDDTKITGTHYNSSDDTKTYFTFNEHFMNIKQYRKLKLKKINERR